MPVKTGIFWSDSRGFTLVELLITIAISILIMAALIGFFVMQRNNADLQMDVAATQQDLRGLQQMLARNIRMAGYNPQSQENLPSVAAGGAIFAPGFQLNVQFNGVQTTNVTTDAVNMAFVADFDGNGRINNTDQPLEQIAYRFIPNCGNGIGCLAQYSPVVNIPPSGGLGTWQPVAQNIDGVQFLYQLGNGNTVTNPAAAQLNDIRAVTVTILARAAFPKKGFTNNIVYRPPNCPANLAPTVPNLCPDGFNGDQPWNDNFLRQMLIFTVQCRNM